MTTPVRFSDRFKQTPPAPISYLMEQAIMNPRVISLAAGLVDHETLPVAEVASAFEELFADEKAAREALQYGTTPGLGKLREAIAQRLARLDRAHVPAFADIPAERLILGTGSQQLIYILAEILLDPGDIVLTSAPTYFVYLGALESFGVHVVPVATDDDGLIPEALEEALRSIDKMGQGDRVKMIYDVSYFNNPTGLTLSTDRRQRLVQLARQWSGRQRLILLEDAAYRELRYHGEDRPSMLAFDDDREFVVYTGTFSKPMAPGIRVGYAVAPPEIVRAMVQQKGHHDFGSASLSQSLAYQLLAGGHYDRHLSVLRATYGRKLDAVVAALDENFGDLADQIRWTRPKGGLYVWVQVPEHLSTTMDSPFFQDCLKTEVLYVPGRFCIPDSIRLGKLGLAVEPSPWNGIRLSFGHQSIEQCQEGIRRLADVLRRHLGARAAG